MTSKARELAIKQLKESGGSTYFKQKLEATMTQKKPILYLRRLILEGENEPRCKVLIRHNETDIQEADIIQRFDLKAKNDLIERMFDSYEILPGSDVRF